MTSEKERLYCTGIYAVYNIYIAGPRYGKEMVNRCVAAGCSNIPSDRVGSVAVAPG